MYVRFWGLLGVLLCFLTGQAAAAPLTKLKKIQPDLLGSIITVQGEIEEYNSPRSERAPHALFIKEDGARFRLVIWQDDWSNIAESEKLRPPARIHATIRVKEYAGKLEGHVIAPSAIGLGPAPEPRWPLLDTLHSYRGTLASVAVTAGLAILLLATGFAWFHHAKKYRRAALAAEERASRQMQFTERALSCGVAIVYTFRKDAETGAFIPTFVSRNISQLGYDPSEPLTNSAWWVDLVHPDDKALVTSERQRILEEESINYEFRFRQKDGSFIWLRDTRRLIRDALNQPYEIVGSWLDVSRSKRAEGVREELLRLGKELNGADSPRKVAETILKTAEHLFGWHAAFVNVLDPDFPGQVFWLISYDLVNGTRQDVTPDSPGIASDTARELRSTATLVRRRDEVEASKLVAIGDHSRHSASLMFAPVTLSDGKNMLISIQSYDKDAYSSEDLQNLQMLGNYCAAALERTFVAEKARTSEARYALAVQGANDGIWDWDLETQQVFFSPRWKSILGYDDAEIGTSIQEWFSRAHPDDKDRLTDQIQAHLNGSTPQIEIQHRLQHKSGKHVWVLARAASVKNAAGNPSRLAGSLTDISHQKAIEHELAHGAYHDTLTGLPNRLHFMEQLTAALGRASRRQNYDFAVLFIDLDNFKRVNDSLGHVSGDELLVHVARKLETCIRPGDVVARLGGDEFTILLDDVLEQTGVGGVSRVASRIQQVLSQPVHVSGQQIVVRASIGIAMGSLGYTRAEDILRDADIALYRAKDLGRSRYEMFDASMHRRALVLMQTESDLRYAIEHKEFFLVYQPIVSVIDGRIFGFEALVRWNHPTRGMVSPTEFIPVAEETGIIIPLGDYVLQQACADLATWTALAPAAGEMSVTVNVSAKQFSRTDLPSKVRQALHQSGINANRLKLEITEGVLMDTAPTAVSLLNELKEMDVDLLIDDFGTGYSSLQYLQKFPIDALKIDRAFIQSMPEKEESVNICRAIVNLSNSMRMGVVAEGVETIQQLEALRTIGCPLAQGFYFSRPVESSAVPELIRTQFAGRINS